MIIYPAYIRLTRVLDSQMHVRDQGGHQQVEYMDRAPGGGWQRTVVHSSTRDQSHKLY